MVSDLEARIDVSRLQVLANHWLPMIISQRLGEKSPMPNAPGDLLGR